jgi:hypothetical protein
MSDGAHVQTIVPRIVRVNFTFGQAEHSYALGSERDGFDARDPHEREAMLNEVAVRIANEARWISVINATKPRLVLQARISDLEHPALVKLNREVNGLDDDNPDVAAESAETLRNVRNAWSGMSFVASVKHDEMPFAQLVEHSRYALAAEKLQVQMAAMHAEHDRRVRRLDAEFEEGQRRIAEAQPANEPYHAYSGVPPPHLDVRDDGHDERERERERERVWVAVDRQVHDPPRIRGVPAPAAAAARQRARARQRIR